MVRLHEMERLDRDFDQRAWLYGGVVAVALAVAAAVALARAPLEQHRRVFAEAGVAGVLVGLVGAALLIGTAMFGRDITPPVGAVFLPSLTLFGIAGIGGSLSRMRSAPAERRERRGWPTLAARLALLCTGFTLVLAWTFAEQQSGSCDGDHSAPAWATEVAWVAVVTACAAGVLGLAGLAGRRWFVAVVSFVINAVALFYMLLSTGVAC
jgi:hypothetical protein